MLYISRDINTVMLLKDMHGETKTCELQGFWYDTLSLQSLYIVSKGMTIFIKTIPKMKVDGLTIDLYYRPTIL